MENVWIPSGVSGVLTMCGGDSIYVPSHPSHSGSSPLAFPLLLRFALVQGVLKTYIFCFDIPLGLWGIGQALN